MVASAATILYRLVEPGANLSWWEKILTYCLVGWFATVPGTWGDALWSLFAWNARTQLLLFVPVVQLPCLITGHMSYVDVGWPTGLMVLALNALWYGRDDGTSNPRTQLAAGALFLHGLRMLLGMFYLHFPFIWKEDLSRYQYAKTRWMQHTDQCSRWWWLKQQHDVGMQAFANSCFLAAPIFLIATNPNPNVQLRPLELAGFVLWVISWSCENWCDISKLACEKHMATQRRQQPQQTPTSSVVLGYTPPYNQGMMYFLWTRSRHPNYFCEWMCWNAFVIMALPSAWDFTTAPQQSILAKLGVWAILGFCSRLFYDCLVYWTGAAPAESRSVQRRPAYRQYQAETNVLFPFFVPWVDHHRTPGWPLADDHQTTQKQA